MKITAAESSIMEVLWRDGSSTLEDIVAEVGEAQQWGRATVKTLLTRLLKKGAVRSERAIGHSRYSPLISRSEYVTAESRGLLDRFFGGSLAPLISHFAEHRDLSEEEIARLKALVEKIDER